jgi:hypothetical protein
MSRGIKDAQLLTDLETIALNLGIDIRYEKGDFEGGLCRLDDNRFIIINKTLSDKHKIRMLARELGTLDLESVYIIPALRQIIDQHLDSTTHKIITDK